MIIEKSGFLLMAGTLAAGGVGGWLAHDSKAHRERVDETPVPVATSSAAPVAPPATVVEQAPPVPLCDDTTGSPADCPAMGPADEGMCSNVAAKRCAEFKSAFKPKVAEAAVACLRKLKPNEQCDPARVNLCGHSALMAACPDQPASTLANGTSTSNGANAANGGLTTNGAAAGNAPPSAVASACDTILKGCGAQASAPALADCRQTLSGMSDFGRASMIQCMATHCGDKGLLGCEAVKQQ